MRLYQNQPSGTVSALRALRRNPTEAEKTLLRALREAFPERKWRFQAPIGPFRVDFLCFAERLVIEVDGGQHDEETDAGRTRFIERQGYRVIRFWNNDVLGNTDGIIRTVGEALLSLSHREREGAAKRREGEGDQVARASYSTSPLPPPSAAGPVLGKQRPALFRPCRGHGRPNTPLPKGEGL